MMNETDTAVGTTGELRKSITNFYTKSASMCIQYMYNVMSAAKAQHSSNFKPVFMVPYYDVFGLGIYL